MPKNVYSWTKEKQIWGEMRKHIAARNLHLQRIESPMTGGGTADVEGCYTGRQAWIELKMVRGHTINISDRQAEWHKKRAAAGGRSFVLAWNGKTQSLLLWEGHQARRIREQGIACPPFAVFPCPIDWGALQGVIFHE